MNYGPESTCNIAQHPMHQPPAAGPLATHLRAFRPCLTSSRCKSLSAVVPRMQLRSIWHGAAALAMVSGGMRPAAMKKPLRKGTPRWRLTRAAAGIGGMIIEEESHGLLVAKVTIGLTNAAQNR